MTTLRRTLDYLDLHGVRYAHTTHSAAYTAEQVAAAEHIPPHRLAKNVLYRSSDGYVLVLVPADSFVDPEQVRAAMGVRVLELADEVEVGFVFPDADLGAMPPLGNSVGLPVYLDRELTEQTFIAFKAGTYWDVIHMKTIDFCKLVQPVIGDFCRPKSHFTESFATADLV
jgi:Ala-tRNA(Pro) deacylase